MLHRNMHRLSHCARFLRANEDVDGAVRAVVRTKKAALAREDALRRRVAALEASAAASARSASSSSASSAASASS